MKATDTWYCIRSTHRIFNSWLHDFTRNQIFWDDRMGRAIIFNTRAEAEGALQSIEWMVSARIIKVTATLEAVK